MAVNTRQVRSRRRLRFRDFDEVRADIMRLHDAPHRTLGNWSLAQIVLTKMGLEWNKTIWPKAMDHRSLGHRPRNSRLKTTVWPKAKFTAPRFDPKPNVILQENGEYGLWPKWGSRVSYS